MKISSVNVGVKNYHPTFQKKGIDHTQAPQAPQTEAKSQSKFKKAYKALKMDCARTMDKPQGFQLDGGYLSYRDIMLQNFYNPYTIRRSQQ